MSFGIIHVFNTNSKREMIARFDKTCHEKYFSNCHMPNSIKDGLKSLSRAVSVHTHIVKAEMLNALQSFDRATKSRKLYNSLLGRVGKIICLFVLSDFDAMRREVIIVKGTMIPRVINPTGVIQKTAKGVGVAVGVIAGATTYGKVLYASCIHMRPESALINDVKIEDFVKDFNKIEFDTFYIK